jgi:hypothetical protein
LGRGFAPADAVGSPDRAGAKEAGKTTGSAMTVSRRPKSLNLVESGAKSSVEELTDSELPKKRTPPGFRL